MDRREFFQSIALTGAVVDALAAAAEPSETLQCEFQYSNTTWKVYEDLSKRDGSLTFVPAHGPARIMTKRPEASFRRPPCRSSACRAKTLPRPCRTCWRTNCYPAAAIPMRRKCAMPLPSSAVPRHPIRMAPRAAETRQAAAPIRGTPSSAPKNASTPPPSTPPAIHAPIIPTSTFPNCRAVGPTCASAGKACSPAGCPPSTKSSPSMTTLSWTC